MTGFSAAVRTTIRQRGEGWCERCGLQRGRDHYHRRPRGAGGSKRDDTNVPSNAGFLCGPCHEWCESHRTDAINEGWLVKQHQSPADIPVLYRGSWCYLDDLGNLRQVEAELA